MGCNYSYDNSENEFEILNNNQNYLIVKNNLNNLKNIKKEVNLKSVIDDYKILNEKSKNFKKIYLKSKRKENYPLLKLTKRKNNVVQDRNTINKVKKINNNTTIKNKEIKKKVPPKKIKIVKKVWSPLKIQYLKDIAKDSYSYFYLDNTFTVFKSKDNILNLIYSTKEKSIISYNLIENKMIIEIKNAHNELIINFRYFSDKINKIDLIISISYDNNIKLWDVNRWECLSDFKEINKNGYLLSACFLNDNNNYYIITSSYSDNSELLKVFDIHGVKVKEINNSGDDTSFIDVYYDKKSNKNFIITGNIGYVKSYDYSKNELYHIYGENDLEDHCSIITTEYKDMVKMIESSGDGSIRIWNFHTGELLNQIKAAKKRLFGMCLWNSEYLFVGCEDKTIKLIELKSGDIINNLIGKNKVVLTIKKLFHPKFGQCLMSQGNKDNPIKLWTYRM